MATVSRTFDSSLELLDVDGVAISATGDQTAVAITNTVGDSGYVAVFNISANGGTHDASNYFSFQLQASDDGTNYFDIGNAVKSIDSADAATTGLFEVAFTGNQIEDATGGNVTNMRVSATKVGTTATSTTVGCYLAKV